MNIKILNLSFTMKPRFSPAWLCSIVLLLAAPNLHAELIVKVDETKTVGSKTVIKLSFRNTYKVGVQSARATVFLLDDQGKIVGQAVQWVIGGTKDKPPLAPDAATTYNFVIASGKSFSTTKVILNRVVLEGGKLADVNK